MVGIGVIGLAGTGAAYYLETMPDAPEASSAFENSTSVPDFLDEEPGPSPEQVQNTAESEPPAEPDQCRALVNVRLGSAHQGLYNYQVLDVRFDADGGVFSEIGKGLAVQTADGAYALQGHVNVSRGIPQHTIHAYAYSGQAPNDAPLWSYPTTGDGLPENRGNRIWPIYRQRTRVRATIEPYVALHREVVNSEGGMREESGVVLDVRSGESSRPLRLNMSAIEGRAAAFPHQQVAEFEGSEMIWQDFQNKGGDDFLLRLANGPGKSIQPEVGVCCYEREGASQVVFARLDRGAFALMSPGYLSRPHGFVRAGDGCGEFGWDGGTVYARRRDGGPWTPLVMELGQTVQEFLGVYWVPNNARLDVSNQPPPPRLPKQPELERLAENAEKLGRQAFESGQIDTAIRQLRRALRIKMYLGLPVDKVRPMYDKAVSLSDSNPRQPSEPDRR
jgi:hypothetical protein